MFDEWKNKKIKKNFSDFEAHKAYLADGTYYLIVSNDRYFWKQISLPQAILEITREKLPIKRRIKEILTIQKCMVSGNSNPLGTSLYVTRKGNAKIFDYAKQRVHYLFNTSEIVLAADRYHTNYAPFFGESIITEVNLEKRKITELLIEEHENWRLKSDSVIATGKWLVTNEILYLKDYSSAADSVTVDYFDSFFQKYEMSEDLRKLIRRISDKITDRKLSFTFIPQHNDLVLSNILCADGKKYLFDYEFFTENLFYYDVFLWIVWEAIQYRNYTYIEKYLNGDWDSYVEELFTSAGCTFSRESKLDYIYIFILANIRIHQIFADPTSIKNYGEFIDYLERR